MGDHDHFSNRLSVKPYLVVIHRDGHSACYNQLLKLIADSCSDELVDHARYHASHSYQGFKCVELDDYPDWMEPGMEVQCRTYCLDHAQGRRGTSIEDIPER